MQLALYHMYRYWKLDQEELLDHYAQMNKVQVSSRHVRRESSIPYILKVFVKTNIYLFITTLHACGCQGIRNVPVLENLACVLNGYFEVNSLPIA